jgi:hypothetical protein
MCDTGLKNSQSLYNINLNAGNKRSRHVLYEYSTVSNNTLLPEAGVNIPMLKGYNQNILSNNAADIESQLFGIGSANLVQKKQLVTPHINTLNSVKFIDTLNIYLPQPMVIDRHQRPRGPFC